MFNAYTPNYYPNSYPNNYSSLAGYNQKAEIIKVNGENGARAYNLPPNSSALLLDESQPIIWLVQTDGAGYKTVNAYDISPHKSQDVNNIDISSIEARLKRLEDIISEPHITTTQQASTE